MVPYRIFPPRRLFFVAAVLLTLAFTGAHANPFVITTASSAGSTGATTGETIADDDDEDFARANRFAESQFALIRREAAAGGGEHLRALAALLDEPDAEAFEAWMQTRYARLFAGPDAADKLVARIVALRRAS